MNYDDLKERVLQFNMLELPGQPMMMHMGTAYLVGDLWKEVQDLRERVKELEAANGKEEEHAD